MCSIKDIQNLSKDAGSAALANSDHKFILDEGFVYANDELIEVLNKGRMSNSDSKKT